MSGESKISQLTELTEVEPNDLLPIVDESNAETKKIKIETVDARYKPSTTKGDLIGHDGTQGVRVPVGANGQFLVANEATPSGIQWATLTFSALAPTTTKGDLIVRNSSTDVRVPVGTNGQVLVADSATATGVKWDDLPAPPTPVGFDDLAPTTTKGDLIYHDGDSNVRLPVGTAGQVLVADPDGSGVMWDDGGNFDDIAPTTTKGDLIAHDGDNNVRVPVGLNGQVLVADNAVPAGVKWAENSGGGGGGAGFETGMIMPYFGLSSPSGWLIVDGRSVGSTASGATALASSDAQSLFIHLWENSENSVLAIQDSAGNPTTRGASAIDDFAADKRMPLPDARGEFIRGLDAGRGVDSGRTLGSAQGEEIESHDHPSGTLAAGSVNAPHPHPSVSVPSNNAPHSHGGGRTVGALGQPTHGVASPPHGWDGRILVSNGPGPGNDGYPAPQSVITPAAAPHPHTGASAASAPAPHGHPAPGFTGATGARGGGETRPRNIALNYIIKI